MIPITIVFMGFINYKPIYNIWGPHIVPGLSSGDFLMAQSNPNNILSIIPSLLGDITSMDEYIYIYW